MMQTCSARASISATGESNAVRHTTCMGSFMGSSVAPCEAVSRWKMHERHGHTIAHKGLLRTRTDPSAACRALAARLVVERAVVVLIRIPKPQQ